MNTRKWIAALMLIALPGAALAQTRIQDGQRFSPIGADGVRGTLFHGIAVGGATRADTVFHVLTMDSDGNLKSTDASRDRDHVKTWQIQWTGGQQISLANGGADSIGTALDVHDYGGLKLMLHVHVRSAATTTVRLAINIREHVDGAQDSLRTFSEYGYTNGPMPAHQDSVVMGAATAPASAAALRLVTIQGADTTQAGHLVTGSLTAPWSGERVIVFDRAREGSSSGLFGYPGGVSVPLDNLFGREVRMDQLTIRIRNLSTATADIQSAYLKGFAR